MNQRVQERNRELMAHMRKAVAEVAEEYTFRRMEPTVIDRMRAAIERTMRGAGAEGVIVHTNFDVRPAWWNVRQRVRLWWDRRHGRIHVNIAYRLEPPVEIEFQIHPKDEHDG